MAQGTGDDRRARRRKGLRLVRSGLSAAEVAERLGVRPETVRRWMRQGRPRKRPPSRPAARAAASSAPASVTAMLKAEAPHIARVLLDMAKAGDVRAAALVMKLLGDYLESGEDINGGDSEAYQRELEREFQSLPPAIASEIVALLAQAEARLADADGGPGQAVDGAGRRPGRLPWEAESDPSPEG